MEFGDRIIINVLLYCILGGMKKMLFEYKLSYYDCQTCQSKIHCKECAQRVYEALEDMDIEIIEADMERKILQIEMDEELEDDVIDALENCRFFAE